MNLKPCAACRRRCSVKNDERRSTESEDGSEECEFVHKCDLCGHVIAVHHYRCTVNAAEGFLEYEMNCQLCGRSEDSHSIDPVDPRVGRQLP